jgi:filamentous hemagglutinin
VDSKDSAERWQIRPYQPGTFTEKILESFAGPHDYLGSLTAYDGLGNLKEGLTSFQRMMFEIQTDIDIPLAAPFAAVTLLNQYGIDWSIFRSPALQAKDRK